MSSFKVNTSQTFSTEVTDIAPEPMAKACLQVTSKGTVFSHSAGVFTNVFNEAAPQVVIATINRLVTISAQNTITILQEGDYFISVNTNMELIPGASTNKVTLRILNNASVLIEKESEYYDNNEGWPMSVEGAWPLVVNDVLTFQYAPEITRNTNILRGTTATLFRI